MSNRAIPLLLGISFLLPLAGRTAPAKTPIAIGSLGFFTPYVGRTVDPIYKQKLTAAGYRVGSVEYQDVTDKSLHPFNLVVVQWAPGEGGTHTNAVWDARIPVLLRYAKAGGGLLITCENSYGSEKALNRLLKPLGAEVLPEGVVDDKNSFQQDNFLQYHFTRTGNIAHNSPVTAGINSFIYPGMYSTSAAYGTLPLRLSPDWQPLIQGEETAHSSSGTIPHAPVLAASRTYGLGRIVVMAMHTTFFFNSGYHQIWEQISMEKGHGAQFLDNAYRWLAAPSIQSHTFGGYRAGMEAKAAPKQAPLAPEAVENTDLYDQILAAPTRPVVRHVPDSEEHWNDYVGLIGAHTALSTGQGTVQEYVIRARQKGYQFIVFTENLEQMDETKWKQLVTECKAASTPLFRAIPGIDYLDVSGNRWVCFNMPRWVPKNGCLTDDGKRVKDQSGLLFGLDWASIFLVNAAPDNYPWFLKFYTGMALASYSNLPGDAVHSPAETLPQYLQVQSNNYNGIPIATHLLYSPDGVATAGGFTTHARARNLSDLLMSFRPFWYANRRSYVSNGPRILDFTMHNGWAGAREEQWSLPLDVSGDSPITDVIVYDQKRPFYHFRPMTRRFHTVLRGYHDQQRFLTIIVKDAQGRTAYGPTAYTSDITGQSIYMCTDMQNTLNGVGFPDAKGHVGYAGVMGNYVTGWDGFSMGILGGDIMPPGLDYIAGGFGGGLSPTAYGPQGNQGGAVAQRDMVFASGDVNIMDNHFSYNIAGNRDVSTPVMDSNTRIVAFTPRASSYNMLILEDKTTFKKDFTFGDRQGPDLTLLGLGGSDKSFLNYTYFNSNGVKRTGKREKDIVDTVPVGGYFSLWPDFYGSFAVYPLSAPEVFSLHGANLDIGRKMAGVTIPAGTTLMDSMMVVRDKFGEETDRGFDRLRALYGFANPPAYRVHLSRGEVVKTPLVVVLGASAYRVVGQITPAPLPNNLPVQVLGVNGNWDAGVYDLRQGRLRRMGVFNGAGYFTADVAGGLNFVAGNLLLANNPDVRLHLFVGDGRTAEVEVHNPTDQPLMAHVIGCPDIPWLASIHLVIHLQPGEQKVIPVQLGSQLVWSQAGVKMVRPAGQGTLRVAALHPTVSH